MGCDIHACVEVKYEDAWRFAGELGLNRCYAAFADLAGVRGPGPEPNGLPDDVSETVEYHYLLWGDDAHSASYLYLHAFARIWLANTQCNAEALALTADKSSKRSIDIMRMFLSDNSDRLNIHIHMHSSEFITPNQFDDVRIVFWFDN